jgi:hypothetical protein
MEKKAFDNNMSGAVFINKDKAEMAEKGQDTSTWADRKGSCEIDGQEYWISGWLKTSKKGEPFLSLAFSPKEPKGAHPEPKKKTAAKVESEEPF